MLRIILMVLRLLPKVPYYFYSIWKCGKRDDISLEEAFAICKKITKEELREIVDFLNILNIHLERIYLRLLLFLTLL